MHHPAIMHERIRAVNAALHNAFVHGPRYKPPLEDPRDIIKRLMERDGFKSERACAIAAGISQPTLSRYMAHKSHDMEVASWRALAELFEVTVSQLLGETPLALDPRVDTLLRAMERLPAPERDALVAAANALAQAVEQRAPVREPNADARQISS